MQRKHIFTFSPLAHISSILSMGRRREHVISNNKNNHLYVPAALSFLFRLLSLHLLLFFCPHQQNTNITRTPTRTHTGFYAKNVTIS